MDGVAIIGMSVNIPGAHNLADMWGNLIEGRDSISRGEPENPGEINAKGIIEGIEFFDNVFFGISTHEASLMDPQQRKWLELVWHALEDAGLSNNKNDHNNIGVFASSGFNYYLLNNLLSTRESMERVASGKGDNMIELLGNTADYIATKTSYYLNLKGPSLTVQSACSSSLTAVHLAVQSLMNYESDISIAGGISIQHPQSNSYLATEGGIRSTDGFCRPFDKDAKGTVFSSGGGAVILKRYDEALEDGDRIYSVILSSAINNDGFNKASFTAPSSSRQADVIKTALEMAELSFQDIQYVETHGTGTPLGDPIEFHGLLQAYKCNDSDVNGNLCALGSIKGNIGHLDAAAGVIGLIKTALLLKNKKIPPMVNYTEPNENIDLDDSPFYIPLLLETWPECSNAKAGVSSFGVGGTNVHVVLAEKPISENKSISGVNQLFVLNGKTEDSLIRNMKILEQWCKKHNNDEISCASSTLLYHRTKMDHQSIVWWDGKQLVKGEIDLLKDNKSRDIAWVFPGQGSQYPGMALDFYKRYTRFKDTLDYCAGIIEKEIQLDIREYLLNEELSEIEKFQDTSVNQVILFAFEYSLAELLSDLGISYNKIGGHSSGEFVIALLEGVFTLEEALVLIIKRGELMSDSPLGMMVAVFSSIDNFSRGAKELFSIASINSPEQFVISGSKEEMEKSIEYLIQEDIAYKIISERYGFHSAVMNEAASSFEQFIKDYIPNKNLENSSFFSTVKGESLSVQSMLNPSYWADHMRLPVLFHESINLMHDKNTLFIEVGPGRTLSNLIDQITNSTDLSFALTGLNKLNQSCWLHTLTGLGNGGILTSFDKLVIREPLISLPGYSFESNTIWTGPDNYRILSDSHKAKKSSAKSLDGKKETIVDSNLLLTDFGLDPFSVESFFNLGIDSMGLSQLSISISEKLGKQVSFRDLITKRNTPDKLSKYLNSKEGA